MTRTASCVPRWTQAAWCEESTLHAKPPAGRSLRVLCVPDQQSGPTSHSLRPPERVSPRAHVASRDSAIAAHARAGRQGFARQLLAFALARHAVVREHRASALQDGVGQRRLGVHAAASQGGALRRHRGACARRHGGACCVLRCAASLWPGLDRGGVHLHARRPVRAHAPAERGGAPGVAARGRGAQPGGGGARRAAALRQHHGRQRQLERGGGAGVPHRRGAVARQARRRRGAWVGDPCVILAAVWLLL